MINDLDETIKQLLVKGVPLDLSEIDVVFDAPTSEWSGSLARPTINCYLYHMVENHELRNNEWERQRSAPPKSNGSAYHPVLRKRLPFRIDACYMITAWATAIEDEHRLLWRTLAALMRYSTIPMDMAQGELAEQELPLRLRVAQPEAPIKNPSDFWSSMEVHIKPSVNAIVTLALDPNMSVEAPLVLTRRVHVFPTNADGIETEDWTTVQFGGWVTVGSGEDTAPVAGARVQVVERGLSTETDEWGRYRFDKVPKGSYTLRATSESGDAERKVEVPGEGYDLVLSGHTDDGASSGDKRGKGDKPEPPSQQGGKSRRR